MEGGSHYAIWGGEPYSKDEQHPLPVPNMNSVRNEVASLIHRATYPDVYYQIWRELRGIPSIFIMLSRLMPLPQKRKRLKNRPVCLPYKQPFAPMLPPIRTKIPGRPVGLYPPSMVREAVASYLARTLGRALYKDTRIPIHRSYFL